MADGNSTNFCWQVGTATDSPSYSCNLSTGYGYFNGSAHTWSDPYGDNAFDSLPGGVDYCSYYGFNPAFNAAPATDEGTATGFTPPSPFHEYQYGSPTGDGSCQFGPDAAHANAGTWGFLISPSSTSGYCQTNFGAASGCGMFHSSDAPALRDHPWASSFGDPTLNLALAWGAHAVGSGDWHGLACIQLADTTKDYQGLLYCFEVWRSDGALCDVNGPACITYDSTLNNVPEDLLMPFGGMTVNEELPDEHGYASPLRATSQTQHATTGYWSFGLSVSTAQLQTLIGAMNAYIDTHHPDHGDLQDYSLDPSDYALAGVACGAEGGTGVRDPRLGSECSRIAVYTSF